MSKLVRLEYVEDIIKKYPHIFQHWEWEDVMYNLWFLRWLYASISPLITQNIPPTN